MVLRVAVKPLTSLSRPGFCRGLASPAGRGNVILVGDDDAFGDVPRFWTPSASSSKTTVHDRKGSPKQQKRGKGRGPQFNMPLAYQELLEEHQERENKRVKEMNGHTASRRGAAWSWPHELWTGVQRTARERLGMQHQKGTATPKDDITDAKVAEMQGVDSSAKDAEKEVQEDAENSTGKVDDFPSWATQLAKWHETLWIEEVAGHLEMRRLDFEVHEPLRVPHWRPGRDGPHDLFQLDLSGLKLGDSEADVIARLARSVVQLKCASGTFKGFAQPGGDPGTLLLAVPEKRIANAEPPFHVQFQLPRFTLRAMHRALDRPLAEKLSHSRPSLTVSDGLRDVSEDEAQAEAKLQDVMRPLPQTLNDCQKRAVATVLEWKSQQPLVIWGPPGTGKTTMAAYIVWHLLQQSPGVSILVAAPSNTGADWFCKKLSKLGLSPGQMFRLNALGRSVATLPEALIPYCRTTSVQGSTSRSFVVPPLEELRQFQIIVTTCICASHIADALQSDDDETAGSGWFSHVLVDEAGEASEPETMVPLTLLRPHEGIGVLLGDHFQLGPQVQAPRAAEFAPLRTPMLARLANERLDVVSSDRNPHRDALRRCENQGLLFLTETYRSHPAIMELYSRVFYNDQLEHILREKQSTLMAHFEAKGLDVPLIFHNVQGRQNRDPDSFSWYNLDEVRLIQQYLLEVVDDPKVSIEPSEVGIITPYVKQAQHIRLCLRNLGPRFDDVDVGTVEHFQGQERKLIIASAVRSSATETEAILGVVPKRPIGFLADPQRLNVTVSRAVAGLVVIGDLQMLTDNDRHWRAIIHLARDMGALRGSPFHSTRPITNTEAFTTEEKPKVAVQANDAASAWETLMD